MDLEEFKSDHDAIITLISEVRQAREDIKEIKDGTSAKIADHEKRLQKIEQKQNSYLIRDAIYVAIGIFLAGLIIYHIMGSI